MKRLDTLHHVGDLARAALVTGKQGERVMVEVILTLLMVVIIIGAGSAAGGARWKRPW